MDARHFDHLARALSEAGTRRGLLALLATLPMVGGLRTWFGPDDAEAKDRRRRRKKRHKKRHTKGKGREQKNKKCKPETQSTTCIGRCGTVANNCKKTVDCGSCDCNPACDECFVCQGAPGDCVPSTAGTPCGAAQSCTGGVVTAAGSCDGTGACTPGAQTSCDPYTICNPAGNACADRCTDSNDCVAGSFCNDQSRCVGDLPDGETCTNAGDCTSGFCVDGVCCNTSCDAACVACNLQGSKGTCTTVPDGSTCGSGDICCAGSCESGVCCSDAACTAEEAPDCRNHDCVCTANSNAPCDPGEACCDDGCFDLDTSESHCGDCATECGPGQTCQNGVCGVVCGSDFCPASSEICFNGECKTCDFTCPNGTCSGAAMELSLQDGGTFYICPGRYLGSYDLDESAIIIGAGQGDDERANTIFDGQQISRVLTAGGRHL